MRIASALITFLSLLPSPSLAQDSPFLAAAARLNGDWLGDGYTLKIDSYRAQANVDPSRPFQWQRFLVKEVAGETVTFTVGAELFEATLQSETLKLTGTTFRGERILQRRPTRAASQ